MLVFQIKPDKASDFEAAWTTIKDKLSKSDKADLKELGDSIKVFKVSVPAAPAAPGAAPQPAVYIFYFAPPSKTLSYEPTKILYDSKLFERAEADAIYKKIAGRVRRTGQLADGQSDWLGFFPEAFPRDALAQARRPVLFFSAARSLVRRGCACEKLE
jgi:hypothetical protein